MGQSGAKGFGGRVLQARLDMAARLRRTVSQVEIGRALGVSGVAVGTWEKSETVPNLETVERLAEFLGVSPGYLAFGEGSATRAASGGAPQPASPPIAQKLTDEEIDVARADAAVQRLRKQGKPARRKRA